MNRTYRRRTLHHCLALFAILNVSSGCILLYSFDAEPPLPCQKADDCPGSDRCGQRVCDKGTCKVINPVGPGVVPFDESKGNCSRLRCDGRGNEVLEIDEADVRNDGNPCTDDVCEEGVPLNRLKPVGTPCGTIPSVTCDGMGTCSGCTMAADCGMDTMCSNWTCESSKCVRTLNAPGMVLDNPIPGDCMAVVCDTAGELSSVFVPEDAPSDGNPCTTDTCTLQGTVAHQLSPNGTKCGDCQTCAGGTCSACNTSTLDCYIGECIPKPKACTNNTECATGYCVDGYCCNVECASACMACSNAKTGVLSGICAPVVNGTDPDDECNDPMPDVCFGGTCQCANGVKDGNETGVDCGGTCAVCTGTWNCGGCVALMPPKCCDFPCNTCTDNASQCQMLEGKTCPIGAQKQTISLGTVNAVNCSFFAACRVAECNCQ